MTSQLGPMKCFGCFENDHMLHECPRMKELIQNGTIIFDTERRRYSMPDGRGIMHRTEESLADAALQNQTLSFRPTGVPVSNLVTLENEVQNYYQQTQNDSDEGYKSNDGDDDDGPYWKTTLHANRNQRTYEPEDSA